MRAFIAIELPANIKDSVLKIQDKLKIALPKVSWVKPENLHFTLKFLGEISDKQQESINQIIREVAGTITDFKIKLESLGAFPNVSRARIIWVGSEQVPEELKQIVEQLETKIAKLGIPKEERPFRAHITIGRIKHNLIPSVLEKEVGKINNLEFNARGITLFQSTLGRLGPTYTALRETSFKIT